MHATTDNREWIFEVVSVFMCCIAGLYLPKRLCGVRQNDMVTRQDQ